MSLDRKPSRELPTLLALLLDGRMTTEDETQLADLLRNRPDAQQIYLDYCWAHALLRRELGGVSDNEEGGMWKEELTESTSAERKVASEELPIQHSAFSVQHSASHSSFQSPAPDLSVPHSSFLIHPSPPPPSFVGGVLFSYLTAALLLGLGLAIGSVWKLPDQPQIARQAPLTAKPRDESGMKVEFVGRITGMVDCQWAEPHTAVPGPVSVPLGRKYALASGLMEITYNTGATVILQGPCTYEVESSTGGFLSLGKLTAKLEKGKAVRSTEYGVRSGGRNDAAENHKSDIINQKSLLSTAHYPLFTIKTPTATVTDLGTEFGVEVRESGATSTSVFRGVVEVQPITREGNRGQAVRLIENESARVEKDENLEGLTVRRSDAEPATFVRAGQLPRYAEEFRLKSFRRWQAYSQQLRRDPSLLAYYDFQQKPGEPAVLPNVAGSGDSSLDGVVENATWSDGRMTGKHALLFQSPTDHVRINLPQEIDSLTLAAWVCFDALGEGQSISGLLMSEGHDLHWQIANWDGHLSLSSPLTGDARGWEVITGYQFHHWMHLACTVDHATAQVRFYANGCAMGGADCPASEPMSIGPAWIGNWKQDIRNFRGRIDELAIFGRPLTTNEIQQMYNAEMPRTAEP